MNQQAAHSANSEREYMLHGGGLEWRGDDYLMRSGEYSIETSYAPRGLTNHVAKHDKQLIGASPDFEKAARICADHKQQHTAKVAV